METAQVLFDSHLEKLSKFFPRQVPRKPIEHYPHPSVVEYNGAIQSVLENRSYLEKAEPGEVDWHVLSDLREAFKDKLKLKFSERIYAEPMILFTADAYENYFLYNMLHPNSPHNPWTELMELIKNDYIFMLSDAHRSFLTMKSNG